LVCIKLQPNAAKNKNKAIKIFRGERGAGDINIFYLTMKVMGYFITGTGIDRFHRIKTVRRFEITPIQD